MNSEPIVYLEKDKAWLFDGENFTPCNYSAVKKYQAGASISLSKLHVGSFKLPSTLSQNDLQIQTEIKMHDEGGLNVDLDYEIASFNHVLEFENSILVEAFASSHEELSACCSEIVKKSKVIDWIVPSFISYASYYLKQKLEAKTDLFYYLDEDDSYGVLFHKGSYVSHRKTLSIKELAKEIGTDETRCKEILIKYGLSVEGCPESEQPFVEALQTIFSKQVEKLVHTINHKRGLFGLEGIDRAFIDFQGHNLKGLDKVFSAYGVEDLAINPLVCHTEDTGDTHRFIKAMYIYLCANKQIANPLNLSPYERQEVWYRRHSGHFMIASSAALVLALIHPSYFYLQNGIYDEKIETLENRVTSMQETTKRLGKKLKDLQGDVKQSKAKLEEIKNGNKVYQITLDTLPLLMNNRNIRQKMMYDALDILQRYKLSTVSLEQNGTQSMNIHVIADYRSRDKIAKFMKAWMNRGYKEAKTQEIYLDKNIYESKIEVLR